MTEDLVFPTKIRVVLVADKGLRRDIVRGSLQQEPDITLVQEVSACAALEEVLGRAVVDVVIWALGTQDMPIASSSVFDRYPRMKVLTILDDGRHNFMWELLPTRRALGELSPKQLMAVIRQGHAG